jgi:hypothetical protein
MAEYKYINCQGTMHTIERAVGFGAKIVDTWDLQPDYRPDRVVVVIKIPAEHAEWQSQRLHSCLFGNQVHDTLEDARAKAAEQCAWDAKYPPRGAVK